MRATPSLTLAPAAPPLAARPGRTWHRFALAALAATAMVAAVLRGSGSEARALRALPAEARAVLYARTLDNLSGVCRGDAKRELSDFCAEQAHLALAFPECDAACALVARASLRSPTR
jgi:hypothetical protein